MIYHRRIFSRVSTGRFLTNRFFITGCICLAALLFIVGFTAVPLSAKEVKVKLGLLEIVPSIAYRGEYQDNIYAQETDKKEDFVHIVTPKITVNYIGSLSNYVKFGYSVDVSKYTDNDEADYLTHAPYISAAWESSSGFYIKAKDVYRKSDDPFGTENTFRQGVAQTERWKNNADLVVGFRFLEKYALEALLGYYLERFDRWEDQWQDRTDLRYGVAAKYYLSPKTSLFAEVVSVEGTYDEQNNGIMQGGSAWSSSTSQDFRHTAVSLGAQFKPGHRLRGTLKLGYGFKDFENAADKNGHAFEDDSSWVADTSLTYTPRPGTDIEFGLGRSQLGAPDNQASSFVDTRTSVKLIQALAKQMSLKLGFAHEYNDYRNEIEGIPEKYFQVYEVTAGLTVKPLKWLTTGLNYEFESKQASDRFFEDEEYDRNILGFIVQVHF